MKIAWLLQGFVAFECKIRADSPTVIKALLEADFVSVMLTGDAPLTALHVATACGICQKSRTALELKLTNGKPEWVGAIGEDPVRKQFKVQDMPALAAECDLTTTEAALEAVAEKYPDLWSEVDLIKVHARCSPQGKAKVIRAMQMHKGHQVMMCGDGGNDVGALKQADVGLALLSGYGVRAKPECMCRISKAHA
jgi:cation-transporting ATPase 13A1